MMGENKSSGNKIIIVVAIIMATASFITINYIKKAGTALYSASDSNLASNEETVGFQPQIANNGTIEIREKMFATQVSDVYLNAEDYLGKTIKLEGLFKSELYYGKEEPYCFVIRYGPGGCCGMDANVGFEVAWAKENAKPYPVVDSWVEATGVLKTYEEDGYSNYLYLDLSSLNVLSRRGAETVKQ
jgi:putative membrane protein